MAGDCGNDQWNLIESDPAVFSELLEDYGVRGLEVNEFYKIDSADQTPISDDFQYVKALIFTFSYRIDHLEKLFSSFAPYQASGDEKVYFSRQIATNACATHALINAIINIDLQNNGGSHFSLGQLLTVLKEATLDMPPDLKGEIIATSNEIKEKHNNFSTLDFFETSLPDPKNESATNQTVVSHFTAFLPINGHLVELDGLKQQPIDHGKIDVSSNNWLSLTNRVLKKYYTALANSDSNFCLLSIEEKRLYRLQDQLQVASQDNQFNIAVLSDSIKAEELKKEKQKRDNEFRRMNFLPLIVDIINEYAKQQQLCNQMKRK